MTVIAALVPTAMSNVSASAGSEIALFSGTSVDTDSLSITGNGDSAKMELKATNDNGKSNRVSDFQLTADNVLSTEIGEKVTVIDNVDFTKAITTDGNNNQKAIGITSNGVIDFTGYAQGVSTLDVVVDDDRAYEAVIVIGEQNQDTVKKEITNVNNNKQVTKFVLPPDPCLNNPTLQQCIVDPCEENPDLPECIVDPCEENPNQPDCEMPTEEFSTEGIYCELQPELCEGSLEETEEEELPEEEELTESTEIEELEEEESEVDESGESEDEVQEEDSREESEGESEEESEGGN